LKNFKQFCHSKNALKIWPNIEIFENFQLQNAWGASSEIITFAPKIQLTC
jgi:hypothetical protein